MNRQQIAVTDNSAIIANQIIESGAAESYPGDSTIDTRFGKITINRDAPIVFKKGLLGMPEKTGFCLNDFPIEKFAQFKLLQSLEENSLSFITLPLDINNDIIAKEDIMDGCEDLGIDISDLALLLIVSVHRETGQVRLSANARAPLFMKSSTRTAEQYVLRNSKYNVRHMITA